MYKFTNISKGNELKADFSGIDLSDYLHLALDSVDQGYCVKEINLQKSNLSKSQIIDEILPWFITNQSVILVDISSNIVGKVDNEILKSFGFIDFEKEKPSKITKGSLADQGKRLIAEMTGLKLNSINLLNNDSAKAISKRDEKKRS